MMGARTIIIGSPANSGVPSGTAKTSPVKRKPRRYSKKPGDALAKAGRPRRYVDFRCVEAEIEQIIDRLRKAGRNHVVAMRGKTADGELEGGLLMGLAGFEIAGGHGQLV